MSGVLRLTNDGGGSGRSTLVADANNDQTFRLPEAGGILLTNNYDVVGGTVTFNGSDFIITNGDLNVDSGTLFVDESTNRVGIGTTSPGSKLQVVGDILTDGPVLIGSTVLMDPVADDLNIAGSGDVGLTIRGTTTNNIFFADGTTGDDRKRGQITYTHSTNALTFSTNATVKVTIDNTGNISAGRDGSSLFLQNGFNDATARINNSGSTNNSTLNFYTTSSGSQSTRLSINPTGLLAQGGRNPVSHGSPQLLLWGDDCTQNITATGSTNFNSFAGLKFTVAGASTGDYSKAGIFVQRQSSYYDLDMLFAFRSTTDSVGVTPADEKLRITSDGILLVGLSTARRNFYGSLPSNLQIQGAGFAACSVFATNGNGAYVLGRSNAADGSSIGNISWQINDGSTMVPGATINCIVDDVPGPNDCPARLELSTRAKGAATQTLRVTIDSTGRLKHSGGVTSNGGGANFTNGMFYRTTAGRSIPPNATIDIVITGLQNGWLTIKGGGYSSAGQSQFACMYSAGGFMTATNTYDVETLHEWTRGATITLTQNASNITIRLVNGSSTYTMSTNWLFETSSASLAVTS